MELTGERLIPAPRAATWVALNDPGTLQACIAGCESLARTDDGFTAVVAVRVGPVSAKFKGNLKLLDVRPPEGYTLQFEGQGGAAGFGKGSAEVSLAEEGTSTRLRYVAKASVGGKMAQIGSRLVDAAAAKIAEDFFAAFEARVAAAAAPAPAPSADAPASGGPAGAARMAAAAPGTPAAAAAGSRQMLWIALAVIAAIVVVGLYEGLR